jgi:hypothetical protein
MNIQSPRLPGWGLDARATTLLLKIFVVEKYKEVQTGWLNSRQILQNLLRKAMAQTGCFANVTAAADDY